MKLAEALSSLDQVLLERRILSDENQRLALEVRNSVDQINARAHLRTSILEGNVDMDLQLRFEKNMDMALQLRTKEEERNLLLKREEQLTSQLKQIGRLLSIKHKVADENIICAEVFRSINYQTKNQPQKEIRQQELSSPEKFERDAHCVSQRDAPLPTPKNKNMRSHMLPTEERAPEVTCPLKRKEARTHCTSSCNNKVTGKKQVLPSERLPTNIFLLRRRHPLKQNLSTLRSLAIAKMCHPKK